MEPNVEKEDELEELGTKKKQPSHIEIIPKMPRLILKKEVYKKKKKTLR